MIPKFKAYNPATNYWYDPTEVFVSNGNIYIDDEDFEGIIQNNDIELMQSTGLFDKNGVEIFEDDVIRVCDEAKHKVKFIQGAFCVDFPKNGTPLLFYGENQLEVIGNIWEKPKSLEERR